MKSTWCGCILAAAGLAFAVGPAYGQTDEAGASVDFEVEAINLISISGNPSALVISAASGGTPTSVTNTSTTYSVTTNETGQKITGEIDEDMPAGVTLSVKLAAPSGASSEDWVDLTAEPADLVTGITTVHGAGLSVEYRLAATLEAGVVDGSRTLTYTITAGGEEEP